MCSNHRGQIGLVALVFAIVANGSASASACNNATLNGVYGFLVQGNDGTGFPSAAIDQFTADGAGNITSGTEFNSSSGTVQTVLFTGTYTIAKNCTGTLTLTKSPDTKDGSLDLDIVLDDSKKGFQLIRTDAGHQRIGFGLSQGIASCSQTGSAGVYALNLSGVYLNESNPAVSIVGQSKVSSNGNLSGTITSYFNDLPTDPSGKFSGTYSVGADCLGSSVITNGGVNYTFDTIVVGRGSELLILETDESPPKVVWGTEQK